MKNTKKKDLTFTIPHEIMSLVDIGKSDSLNIEVTDDVIVIMKTDKTAKELLKTINYLNELSSELVVQLAMACDECEDCYECYDCNEFDDENFELVPIPVFNAFLDANICLKSLLELINSDEVIEVADVE